MYTPSAAISCVAETKPVIQKNASVSGIQLGSGNASATPPSDTVSASSIASTKNRFVRNISTTGAHSGLIVHGRYIAPVNNAMSGFDTPRFLYMIAATTVTVIIGAPIAKYSDG